MFGDFTLILGTHTSIRVWMRTCLCMDVYVYVCVWMYIRVSFRINVCFCLCVYCKMYVQTLLYHNFHQIYTCKQDCVVHTYVCVFITDWG